MDKTPFQMSRVGGTTDAESSAGGNLSETLPFQSGLRHRHHGSSEPVGSRKHNPKNSSSVTGRVTTREHVGST